MSAATWANRRLARPRDSQRRVKEKYGPTAAVRKCLRDLGGAGPRGRICTEAARLCVGYERARRAIEQGRRAGWLVEHAGILMLAPKTDEDDAKPKRPRYAKPHPDAPKKPGNASGRTLQAVLEKHGPLGWEPLMRTMNARGIPLKAGAQAIRRAKKKRQVIALPDGRIALPAPRITATGTEVGVAW